jgi:hypothetical protein
MKFGTWHLVGILTLAGVAALTGAPLFAVGFAAIIGGYGTSWYVSR